MREREERHWVAIDEEGSLGSRAALHGISGVARDGDEHHVLEPPREGVPGARLRRRHLRTEEGEEGSGNICGGVLTPSGSEPEELVPRRWLRELEVEVEHVWLVLLVACTRGGADGVRGLGGCQAHRSQDGGVPARAGVQAHLHQGGGYIDHLAPPQWQ